MELFKLLGTIAIQNSEANEAIEQTTGKAQHSEGKITSAFKKIGTAVVTFLAVDKIKAFGNECVNMASDVQEVQNKFDVVFQGMTDSVEEWAKTYADSIGRNRNAIKTYLADNQNMFVGMGMTREQGAKLSEQLVELGLDLASFNNLQEDDAVNALSKALMGETESAKRLGAVLNDNTLAMAQEQLGYQGKFKDLTETQKMEVRYQAILMQSQDAVGDCARSLDSYKGRQIQAQSAMENFKETIGTRLIPYMTKMQEKFALVFQTLSNYVNPAFDKLEEIAGVVAEKFSPLIDAFRNLGSAIADDAEGSTLFQDAFSAMSEVISAVWVSVGQPVFDALVAGINWLAEYWPEISANIASCFQLLFDIISTIWTSIGQPLYDLMMSCVSALAEWFTSNFGDIGTAVQNAFSGIEAFWNEHLKPCFEAIGNFIENVLAPVFEFVFKKLILPYVSYVFKLIGDLWNNSLKPVFTGIIDFLTGVFSGNWKKVFTSLVDVAKGLLNGIKTLFKAPFDAAEKIVKSAIDKIKGFFNFDWSLPKLKMPHPTISGSFSLNPPSVPKFGIDWYAKAMDDPIIMNSPTAFGINKLGEVMAGGEKGSEVVSGTDTLMNMISQAVAAQNDKMYMLVEKLFAFLQMYIPELANMKLVMDSGALVGELAPGMDDALGRLAMANERGV